MPYDDDDDLFGEEFDFVDDDDSEDDSELEEKPKAKPTKKKPAAKSKDKAEKPASRAPKRSRSTTEKSTEKPAAKREPRRADGESKGAAKPASPTSKTPPAGKPPIDSVPVGYLSFADGLDDEEEDDLPFDDEPPVTKTVEAAPEVAQVPVETPAAPPAPAGPPADHVIHLYEHGKLRRTIPRKFTDEQAVGFAEEYTRTNKAYGRYAVATPDDEEPSPTFAGAAQR